MSVIIRFPCSWRTHRPCLLCWPLLIYRDSLKELEERWFIVYRYSGYSWLLWQNHLPTGMLWQQDKYIRAVADCICTIAAQREKRVVIFINSSVSHDNWLIPANSCRSYSQDMTCKTAPMQVERRLWRAKRVRVQQPPSSISCKMITWRDETKNLPEQPLIRLLFGYLEHMSFCGARDQSVSPNCAPMCRIMTAFWMKSGWRYLKLNSWGIEVYSYLWPRRLISYSKVLFLYNTLSMHADWGFSNSSGLESTNVDKKWWTIHFEVPAWIQQPEPTMGNSDGNQVLGFQSWLQNVNPQKQNM
jgi:hypothetical protein